MINKEHKILLTGGTGFLGSHILDELVGRGYGNIVVLSRKEVQQKLNGVLYVTGDILDVFFLDSIFSGVDFVIHAAAVVSFQKKDRKQMFAVNVEGTANLVNTAIAHSIKSFIHVSSAVAIGKNLDDTIVDESTAWSNKLSHTQYALSKFMGEKQVWRGHAEGLDVSIVNPSLILGRGDWKTGTSGFFRKIDKGLKYFPTGSNGMVSAKDVSRFICTLLEQRPNGERFILSAENMKYEDLFSLIANHLDVPSPHRPIQGKLKIFAYLKEVLSNLSGSHSSYLSRESIENISEVKAYSNSKSISLLDFQYQAIPELIHELAKTYQEEKD